MTSLADEFGDDYAPRKHSCSTEHWERLIGVVGIFVSTVITAVYLLSEQEQTCLRSHTSNFMLRVPTILNPSLQRPFTSEPAQQGHSWAES